MPTKTNDHDDDSIFEQTFIPDDLVQVYPASYEYVVNIDSIIVSPSFYRPILTALKNARKQDRVTINITTQGGDVATAMLIMNHILKCDAEVSCVLYEGCSAGSMLALCCDRIELTEFSFMMIHGIGTGLSGNVQVMENQSKFFSVQNKDIISSCYKTFLTEVEMQKVINGEEVWMNKKEIAKRLKTWIPIRKRKGA